MKEDEIRLNHLLKNLKRYFDRELGFEIKKREAFMTRAEIRKLKDWRSMRRNKKMLSFKTGQNR
jgi:ribosomal protein S21